MDLAKRFPKKRIIITGAGSGLGRALALEFAKMNWRIAIAEINRKRARETLTLVNEAGGWGLEIHCDVTRSDDVLAAKSILQKEWGGVDILVNNVGVLATGYFEEVSEATWDWIYNLNLKSGIHICCVFIPLFKEQRSGYIVNVASNAGIASLPEMGSYNIAKAGVISLSETLRSELAPFNIGVSVVCPTFFRTNLMDQFTSPNERQRIIAEIFFENSSTTSEKIAQHIVRSIRKNRLYVITQKDGKFMWRLKRWFPEFYFKGLSYIYKKGYFDKYLGLFLRILNFKIK